MRKAARKKLAKEMYPESLRDVSLIQVKELDATLAEIAQQVCDDLPAGETEEFAATVIISELQMEMKRAHAMLRKLRADVSYAEEVFAETCDCATKPGLGGYMCGPCKKLDVFHNHQKEAQVQIDRCSLCLP
jgi:hypothetical protein